MKVLGLQVSVEFERGASYGKWGRDETEGAFPRMLRILSTKSFTPLWFSSLCPINAPCSKKTRLDIKIKSSNIKNKKDISLIVCFILPRNSVMEVGRC